MIQLASAILSNHCQTAIASLGIEDLLHKPLQIHTRDISPCHAVQSCRVGMHSLHEDTLNRQQAPAHPCSRDSPILLSCRGLYCAEICSCEPPQAYVQEEGGGSQGSQTLQEDDVEMTSEPRPAQEEAQGIHEQSLSGAAEDTRSASGKSEDTSSTGRGSSRRQRRGAFRDVDEEGGGSMQSIAASAVRRQSSRAWRGSAMQKRTLVGRLYVPCSRAFRLPVLRLQSEPVMHLR